jgi:hypothetical protein
MDPFKTEQEDEHKHYLRDRATAEDKHRGNKRARRRLRSKLHKEVEEAVEIQREVEQIAGRPATSIDQYNLCEGCRINIASSVGSTFCDACEAFNKTQDDMRVRELSNAGLVDHVLFNDWADEEYRHDPSYSPADDEF